MQRKIILLFIIVINFQYIQSQNKELNSKILDSILTIKKEMINDFDVKTFYTIQIYSGRLSGAKKIKGEYDQKNYPYRSIIEYETPNYKVWIGKFRTKLNADKSFFEIKKDFPNALLFRPGR